MKIDGVDFSNNNHHTLRMWDEIDEIGPYPIIVDEKIRIGNPFTIFIQDDTPQIYTFIERQCDSEHQCNLSIIVSQAKTRKIMYNLILRVILVGLRFGDNDSSDIFLIFKPSEIEDNTTY